MTNRRGAVAGSAGAACLGAAALAVFVFDRKTWWEHTLFVVLLVFAVIAFVILLVAGLLPDLWAWLAHGKLRLKRSTPAAGRQFGPATTGRWRHTSTSMEVPTLPHLENNSMSHPGYNQRVPLGIAPPSVRFGALIACGPLGPTPPTSQLRASFLNFLNRPPVSDLIAALTHVGPGVVWRPWDSRGRLNLAAVLTGADETVAPVAWARLLPPEAGISPHAGRDWRTAAFILHVEPRAAEGEPTAPLTLPTWHDRLVRALDLPGALVLFLTQDLGLATSNDPAAQFGVWLKTPQSMTELVDTTGLSTIPDSPFSAWFSGWAIADPDGKPAAGAVLDLLVQLCDYTLYLNNYEPTLDAIARQYDQAPIEVRNSGRSGWLKRLLFRGA